jgi:hypothetical protein
MTPFVPGFENDLFISYAHHDDPAWTQAFEKALREEVSRRLGLEIAVWQDEKRIRAGQNWQDEIKAGIERCAAFVAIISPSYENSDWCTRERVAFRQLFASPEQFESSNRFFIAVKTPWEKNNHRFFLSKIKPVLFFRAGEEAERDTEFLPGSSDFRSSIAILATGIADLLRRLRRQRERVFVGSPQDECVQIWRELGEELRTLGYDVQPPGRRDASFADELVRQEMNGAKLSIHLIGSAYDEFIERQIVLAADLEHRLVFWLAADSQSTGDPRQRELVTTVRDGKRPRASNRTLPDGWMPKKASDFLVNPTGNFVVGGPDGDCGLTGRKIIVDTYGGYAPHGGGAFSGKDPTKVDRSAAYAARYLAKNVVAAGFADRCTIQVAYAIGVADPMSLLVDTHGTGKVDEKKLEKMLPQLFRLTPTNIRRTLKLNRPIYRRTASYGHFGRAPDKDGGFSWEKTDLVPALKGAV